MLIRTALLCLIICSSKFGDNLSVELVNNQPFDIRMPITLRGTDAKDHVVIADVPALQTKHVALSREAHSELQVEAIENAVRLRFKGKDLGTLTWDVAVRPAEKSKSDYISTKRDFDKIFKPLPLNFEQIGKTALFDTWTARTKKDGVELVIELHAYHDGFLDHTHFAWDSRPR